MDLPLSKFGQMWGRLSAIANHCIVGMIGVCQIGNRSHEQKEKKSKEKSCGVLALQKIKGYG